ncbi:M20/M25/M40 family metallo-hydrolase [Xanthomonas sacchari]|uniref:M20/M25/M40 family metallo-hydrolase n=1 Tax=Xanthomonas sacchari TaxID=56458 RepID=UPI00224E6282|nr:M20/M25/M40 family metallo-hydrolase [Xanthomonas sacchari]UYK68509.1 M20/M25/M40 family metallo-hydrolase [Xanthomonas sacchari]
MSKSDTNPRSPSIPSILSILCFLAACAWIGLLSTSIPSYQGESNDPKGFSVERVMRTTEQIASSPHPIGSAANAAVRKRLMDQLGQLGVQAEVQQGLGVDVAANGSRAGFAHNIIARLPGRLPGKALMLVAHYDSVVNGSGAADDAASVAAILETLRVLKAGKPLRNDVVVLLTDGEEAGSLGARAFLDAHSADGKIGLVLNFEYRGNAGPVYMFQTSRDNATLIDGFATAPRPVGTSLMSEIYRLMPNDTDLSAFLDAGVPGLNFAAIGGMSAYHTPLDRPENISKATLLHQGQTMLAMTRHFGNADISALQTGDAIYFNLPGLGLVRYSTAWTWPLSITALALLALAFHRGVRRGELRPARAVLALPVLLLLATILAIAVLLLWLGICAIQPAYRNLGEVYNPGWYWLGFVAFGIGGFTVLAGRLGKRITPVELGMGALLGWSLALLASAAWAPGFNFLLVAIVVPPLLVINAGLWPHQALDTYPTTRSLAWATLAVIPGTVLAAPLLQGLLQAVTTHAAALAIFVLALLLGPTTPLLAALRRRWLIPAIPCVASVVLIVAGLLTTGFDRAHPIPDSLIYVQNGNDGKAFWISPDATLDAWAGAVFGSHPQRRKLTEVYGPQARDYWVSSAPSFGLPAPAIDVLHDTVAGDIRTLQLRIRSLRRAPEIRVFPEGAELLGVRVGGKDAGGRTSNRWGLILYALPAEGIDVELRVKANKSFGLRVVDRTYGLGGLGAPERASDRMAEGNSAGDTVQSVKFIKF